MIVKRYYAEDCSEPIENYAVGIRDGHGVVVVMASDYDALLAENEKLRSKVADLNNELCEQGAELARALGK